MKSNSDSDSDNDNGNGIDRRVVVDGESMATGQLVVGVVGRIGVYR